MTLALCVDDDAVACATVRSSTLTALQALSLARVRVYRGGGGVACARIHGVRACVRACVRA